MRAGASAPETSSSSSDFALSPPNAAPVVYDIGSSTATRAKLTAMSERIRALEDALQIEFSARNQEARPALEHLSDVDTSADDNSAARIASRSMGAVHPLLIPRMLDIKKDIDAFIPDSQSGRLRLGEGGGGEEDALEGAASDMMTAFGTLSISDGKNMRFLGASATEVRSHSSFFPPGTLLISALA